MKSFKISILVSLFSLLFSLPSFGANLCEDLFSEGPHTRKDNIVHSDPFRWLEEASAERNLWLRSQSRHTAKYFKERRRTLRKIRNLLGEQRSQENVIRSFDLGNKRKIQLVDRGLNRPIELLLLKKDKVKKVIYSTENLGPNVYGALDLFLSPNKRYAIFPLHQNGSTDEKSLVVFDTKTGEKIQQIENASYSVVWTGPSTFVYSKYISVDLVRLVFDPKNPQKGQVLYEPRSSNQMNDPDKKFFFRVVGDETKVRFIDGVVESPISHVVGSVLGSDEEKIVTVKTDEDGYKSIYFNYYTKSLNSELRIEKSVQAFDKHMRFKSFYSFDGQNYVTATDGDHDVLLSFDTYGKLSFKKQIPSGLALGQVSKSETSGRIELSLQSDVVSNKKIFLNTDSKKFLNEEGQVLSWRQVKKALLTTDEGVEFISKVVKAKSEDGEMIPVRIVHRKGLRYHGKNPVLTLGYGGFNIPGYFDPRFNPVYSEFINYFKDGRGGVLVKPALRGGNEFGPDWHKAGQFEKKQNVFNDMIATVEKVHSLGISSPEFTAGMGWSNGGLLTGAMATQRPDLFRVLVLGNGVQDMLRKELLDWRFGQGWSYEWGSSTNPVSFQYLNDYSPVHNAKPAHYPTVLVSVGLNDTRVNPVHSFKVTAALQDAQLGDNGIILSPVRGSGHWMTSDDLQDYQGFIAASRIWTAIFADLQMEL